MRLFRNLTVRVLVAIALGVLLGVLAPETAKAMKPVGDTFINLVRMVIGPIIFLTIVLGIANMADLKKVGKVGAKALIYFEIVTTFALAIGLIVVNVTKPGAGINVSALAKGDVSKFAEQGKALSFVEFLTHIVPTSVVKAFADGDILQIVFFAVLFGVALTAVGSKAAPLTDVLDKLLQVFFRIVHLIMVVAPIGAFGAMAFTIGNFGLDSLLPLGRLMLDVYVTMFLFVFVVLNIIARLFRFSLWEYLKYIREEIVLGARHIVVGGRAAADARQDGALWRAEDRRRVGDSGRVFVQPRRHVDLPVDGVDLHRSGIWGEPVHRAADLAARGADGDVEGRGRCDGLGIHRAREHARRDARGSGRRTGAGARRGPVHVRGASDRQSHRQRRGDDRHRQERRHVRRGEAGRGGRGDPAVEIGWGGLVSDE